jgi:preprotein translocase subunit SecG
MTTVVLVIHLMIAVALVAVILLQRSEGGALGIGGGGGMVTGRSAANILTRITAVLAAIFFATSIVLTIFSQAGSDTDSILESVPVKDIAPPAPGEAVKEPSEPKVPLAQ